MKLRKMTIRNFRGIGELELEFDDTTVLIGENNSGKTSVLDALRLCLRELGPRRGLVFDSYDFHLKDATSDPALTDPLQITISFSESSSGEWDPALVGRLNRQKILQVDASGRAQVVLRVDAAYDVNAGDFTQTWSFLNLDGQPLQGVSEGALATLQREISYFYLAALRDAARHFDAKGPFWRPFLKEGQLSGTKKAEIEQKLKELNELVVASHTSFELARKGLQNVQDAVPLAAGDAVSIEAVPQRVFDMLARAQLHLGASTGAKVPVGRHGEGTQSLAVLMLFSAFLEAWPKAAPVVALEEPESHLHPSAVRALWGLLGGIKGQKIIATHSGDLLSEIDIHGVRRLARTPTGVRCHHVPAGLLSDEELRKFNYHVRRTRGELLFARCWLLVEGETETWLFPAAARATGVDLHQHGIRLVEYSQSDVGLLAKVANALGIPWHCVIDDDDGRASYEPVVKAHLAASTEADCISLPYRNPETHLISNGFQPTYAPFISTQLLGLMTTAVGDPTYWQDYAKCLPARKKTRAAAAAAAHMEQQGAGAVTDALKNVLAKAVARAGAT